MLTRSFRELGIPFLDLGALEVDDPRTLYFLKDPHLNPIGHEFVARALADFLASASREARGHAFRTPMRSAPPSALLRRDLCDAG